MKFQIVKNTSGQFYWRLVASNHLVIAVGVESYGNRADCRQAIDVIVRAPAAQFHVYQDFQKLWRWRLSSTNGQVVAISGESYVNLQGAADSAGQAAATDGYTPLEELHDSGTAIRARWPKSISEVK